jgi:hypothetical protein
MSDKHRPSQIAQRWVLGMQAILTELNHRRHDVLGGAPRLSGPAACVLSNSWGVRTSGELEQTFEHLRRKGDRGELAEKCGCAANNLLAWDYLRMAAVAGWGFAADLMARGAAWDVLCEVARAMQNESCAKATFDRRLIGPDIARQNSAWTPGVGATNPGPRI